MLNVWIAAALLASTCSTCCIRSRLIRRPLPAPADRKVTAMARHEGERWSLPRAFASLVVASLLAAWMSEILVGAADGTGKALGMSSVFIGIVFLAVVGGAAESGSAIAMGAKNKVDLSIGIAMGSSIQIALFIAPVLVFASYFIAPAATGTVLRPRRSGLAVHRRDHRRAGVRRRPVQLVQGRAAHHCLPDLRRDVLFHAGSQLMSASRRTRDPTPRSILSTAPPKSSSDCSWP